MHCNNCFVLYGAFFGPPYLISTEQHFKATYDRRPPHGRFS